MNKPTGSGNIRVYSSCQAMTNVLFPLNPRFGILSC